MRAGRLRHRGTLQAFTTTQNAFGEQVETWADVGTYWMAIEPVSGKERFASGQRVHEQDARIVMRYIGEIVAQNRIVHDGTTYDIKAIINRDLKNREYELLCTVHE